MKRSEKMQEKEQLREVAILKARFLPEDVDQPKNPLFAAGSDWNLNACVGANGGQKDLYDYGRGFIEAGHAIVQAAINRSIVLDLAIYPAAFSYRHGVELLLKHLIGALGKANGTGEDFPRNHGIDNLMAKVLEINAQIDPPIMEAEAPGRVSELVQSFHDIDATNQVFRYPIGTKNEQHLADYKLINVEVLHAYMVTLYDFLSRWIDQAERRIADNAEAFGYE